MDGLGVTPCNRWERSAKNVLLVFEDFAVSNCEIDDDTRDSRPGLGVNTWTTWF